jgi:hypothetical protein
MNPTKPLRTPPVIPRSENTAQFTPWPICESGSTPKQIGQATDSVGVRMTRSPPKTVKLAILYVMVVNFLPHADFTRFAREIDQVEDHTTG